jgi:hypothetical protein
MNIMRHLDFNSVICRSPDDPAAPEPVVVEPAPIVADPPAPDPAPDPAVVDPAPEPAPAAPLAAEQPPTIPVKTFQRVVAEVREDRRQADARAQAAEQRASDLQAIIDRMQADPTAAPAAPRPAAAPAAPAAPNDFQAAVKAQAAKDRLYEDTVAVRAIGNGKFADFEQSLGILTAIGATSDDFVSDLLAVDKEGAHVILDKLAKDPEKAASLVTMDSRRRIAELTRMTVAPAAAAAPQPAAAPAAQAAPAISRAPAPAPRIAPVAQAQEVDPTTPEGNEKMSDAQWEKWAKSQGGVDGLLKRRA